MTSLSPQSINSRSRTSSCGKAIHAIVMNEQSKEQVVMLEIDPCYGDEAEASINEIANINLSEYEDIYNLFIFLYKFCVINSGPTKLCVFWFRQSSLSPIVSCMRNIRNLFEMQPSRWVNLRLNTVCLNQT